MNKASGGNGIPVELFQILEDDALKVLHSICQHLEIWKIQQWSQELPMRPVLLPASARVLLLFNSCEVSSALQ